MLPCLTGPVDYLFASHHKGPRFKSPGGYLCGTGILLLALSCYFGDPQAIDNFCGLVWGGLLPQPSLSPHADKVIIPLDLTQLSVLISRSLQVPRPASQLTVAGGSPVQTLQSRLILTMSHWSSGLPICFPSQGPGFKSPGGYLWGTGILLF
jgi:hypothetical protein